MIRLGDVYRDKITLNHTWKIISMSEVMFIDKNYIPNYKALDNFSFENTIFLKDRNNEISHIGEAHSEYYFQKYYSYIGNDRDKLKIINYKFLKDS